MTLNEYQKLAARTINQDLKLREIELHALHGLSAEVGEVHGIFQKFYQGHPIDAGTLKKEVGDLLWFVAELCWVEDWDLEDVANMNIEKLRKRYPDGFDVERSRHREE